MKHVGTGKLVVLEGIDGAGKTSTAEYLSSLVAGYQYVSSKSNLEERSYVNDTMRELSKITWPLSDLRHRVHEIPEHCWMHLHAAWHHIFANTVLKPMLADGMNLVMDGYYYKFYAKMKLNGVASLFLNQCFSSDIVPDLVVFLDVDPSIAWDRKNGTASGYEMGSMYNGEAFGTVGKESFIQYQALLGNAIKDILAARKVPHSLVCVGPDENMDQVCYKIDRAVQGFFPECMQFNSVQGCELRDRKSVV